MKKDTKYVKIDSRNRITIPKHLSLEESHFYRIYKKNGNIILEPILEVPKEELWLFEPKNKPVVDQLKKALKQKADREIDLSFFEED
jgi:virulence-associated protein VagC